MDSIFLGEDQNAEKRNKPTFLRMRLPKYQMVQESEKAQKSGIMSKFGKGPQLVKTVQSAKAFISTTMLTSAITLKFKTTFPFTRA